MPINCNSLLEPIDYTDGDQINFFNQKAKLVFQAMNPCNHGDEWTTLNLHALNMHTSSHLLLNLTVIFIFMYNELNENRISEFKSLCIISSSYYWTDPNNS